MVHIDSKFLVAISLQPPTKSTLDDLFADTSAVQKPSAASTAAPAATMSRPSRQQAGSATLGSLLGPSRREKETKPAAATTEPAPTSTPAPQVIAPAPEETLRAKRLENEVERLNREIEEIKRRKKEDEQDIEKLWKEKLAKKDRDHQEELKDLDNAHQSVVKNLTFQASDFESSGMSRGIQTKHDSAAPLEFSQRKQISKLEAEHSEELERLKATYERQLDSIQQSAGQWKDVSTVVDKVDDLSTTINKLADNQKRFPDKYRVREEWNRLNAEKAVFKEDQRFILENIEKQKAALDKSKTAFFQEQHDLLVRVSTERQLLEQERNEFYGKRSTDVRRLKEEAGELQRRAQNVLAAERQVDEMKKHYETKMRQARDLQELEVSLMEECVEMENLRNQMSSYKIRPTADKARTYDSGVRAPDPDLALSQDGQDVPPRNESVRTVLKKHSEFLERYMGQKVAAVAPRPANFDSP
ncbi:hypothetical protein ANCDUO_14795 [Ancylostoma duodenale]|uniref:Uncharacterized protein n=1 Tax=Ancylostoma duodenale TaxID=51022 RepID=A0A0C2GD95_9BILA|nr:hypothetical protein ANCDUO_14795 [Ancylostoma duodenale]